MANMRIEVKAPTGKTYGVFVVASVRAGLDSYARSQGWANWPVMQKAHPPAVFPGFSLEMDPFSDNVTVTLE